MSGMVTHMDSKDTRARVLAAISDLANLVGKTLGPGGRPILLEQEGRAPLSTKDGVTVARHFSGGGDIERVVADAAREVCERTVRHAGDGTTTAIVLASALVKAGQEYLQGEGKGQSPQMVCRELNRLYRDEIKPAIMKLSRPIRNLPVEQAGEAVYRVALVSANHDIDIAKAVAEAVDAVGEDGMVSAEEGIGAETRVEHQKGFPATTGLADLGGAAAAAFVNRQSYGDCVVENTYIAMYDGEINDVSTVIPLMEQVAGEVIEGKLVKAPLVIFAHRFSDQVLKLMAQNFRRGALTVVPVTTPRNGQANSRSEFLYDLAAYVGGEVFEPQGKPLTEASLPQLGAAPSVKVTRSDTVVFGEPELGPVEARIKDLKARMEGASEFDRGLIRYRIGRLTGGVATVYAGGVSALEARERHDRVVDAVSAVRSAMELGVVPGGGATLYLVSQRLKDTGPARILRRAIQDPLHQIARNAGIDADYSPVGNGKRLRVYDALKHRHVRWYDAGIMDPAKVTLTALENALSVAQLLMTLGGVVAKHESDTERQVKEMQKGLQQMAEQM